MTIGVVLHQPQDLVNIAAAVRAMANMGIERLTLVDPAEFDPRRITGIAHRTEPIVEAARLTATLEEALADATYVVGTSARPRTAQRNYRRPRDLAPRILRRARDGDVAIVFGREDRGLSNEALDLCHEVLVVPTAPEYPSLNLAQAVLLVSYELFLAGVDAPDELPTGRRSLGPATAAELEEMYAALEAGSRPRRVLQGAQGRERDADGADGLRPDGSGRARGAPHKLHRVPGAQPAGAAGGGEAARPRRPDPTTGLSPPISPPGSDSPSAHRTTCISHYETRTYPR